jgi:hypothetical protein
MGYLFLAGMNVWRSSLFFCAPSCGMTALLYVPCKTKRETVTPEGPTQAEWLGTGFVARTWPPAYPADDHEGRPNARCVRIVG